MKKKAWMNLLDVVLDEFGDVDWVDGCPILGIFPLHD